MSKKKDITKFFEKLINNSISKKEYNKLLEYIRINPSCPILNDLILKYLDGKKEFKEELIQFNQDHSDLIFSEYFK